jgi:hypothetical protein
MPNHIDIPLEELLVYEGDELIFDGADLATYVVLDHGTDVAAACGSDPRARRRVRRRHHGHWGAAGEVIMFAQLREAARQARASDAPNRLRCNCWPARHDATSW